MFMLVIKSLTQQVTGQLVDELVLVEVMVRVFQHAALVSIRPLFDLLIDLEYAQVPVPALHHVMHSFLTVDGAGQQAASKLFI